MKVVAADELVWKEHPVLKGAQIVILFGNPTKAETVVQRVKFRPHFKVPPHTHPYSELVTVLSGTYWNAMGDDPLGNVWVQNLSRQPVLCSGDGSADGHEAACENE